MSAPNDAFAPVLAMAGGLGKPLLIVVAVVLLAAIVRSLGGADFRSRIVRKPLMTSAEVRFWGVLEAALPEYRIFGQVAVGALLQPVTGLSQSDRLSVRNRFSQKIVDFAIIEFGTGRVVALVELDDRSHHAEKDAARDSLLARGGYVVFRFTGRDGAAIVRQRVERWFLEHQDRHGQIARRAVSAS